MAQSKESVPLREEHSRLLQGVVKQLVTMKGVKHAIATIESRDGSFSWTGTEGIARPDGTPMKADTPFWIASITKLYIAATLLKLHEDKKLSIEDKIIDFLPRNLLQGVHIVGGVDYCDTLTIRHLLSHSSGIPDYLEVKEKGGRTIVDQVIEGSDRSWSIEDVLEIIRKANAPLFTPQALDNKKVRVRYSDTNFQILIAIIEAVTKKPIETVFREMLFQPLGLTKTYHPGHESLEPVEQVATTWVESKPFDDKPQAMRAFGDLNSTTSDLVKFMRALIDGAVFKQPETLDLMRSHWNTFGFALSPLAPGWPIQYGLGMMRFRMPRLLTPLRPMPEVMGHTGAVGSWLFYCPAYDLIVAGTVSQVTAAAAPFKAVPKLLGIMEKVLD